MKILNNNELSQVCGAGEILQYGLLGLAYVGAFISGGPAGLGFAVAATVGEQGIEKLDQLHQQHMQDQNNPLYGFNPQYDASFIGYSSNFG